jgi:excisionase family DNA binding protein
VSITLLKPQEVADTLRVHIRHVYRMVDKGELKAVRFGGSVRVVESSLNALIEAGRTDAHS